MPANDEETGWLVLGVTGQVGRALQAVLADRDATFWDRTQADLSQPNRLAQQLEQIQPTAIINASAYTAVDKAEEEEELAETVNGISVGILAEYAARRQIPLVHYSTDYVFDGGGIDARREDEPTAPLNAYGRSKLAGEQAIQRSGCDYLIFRTSWVYDAAGKNFVNTMLRLGAERESLNIVADQIGAPSYAPHLAEATIACLDKALAMDAFPSGIYHLCHAGETSWHGFAGAIFEQARARAMELKIAQVNPIATSDYPTPATRPLNSRLSMQKLRHVFGITMPSWQEGLKACLDTKKEGMDEAA